MRERKDFEESGPGMRTFSLNSDDCHSLTLEDQEPSMLPKEGRSESLRGESSACRRGEMIAPDWA